MANEVGYTFTVAGQTVVSGQLVSAVDQLHSLYTLLAKTAVVESFDGCDEIRIGEECLHG
jgi:hypothetical protein